MTNISNCFIRHRKPFKLIPECRQPASLYISAYGLFVKYKNTKCRIIKALSVFGSYFVRFPVTNRSIDVKSKIIRCDGVDSYRVACATQRSGVRIHRQTHGHKVILHLNKFQLSFRIASPKKSLHR